MLKVQEKRNHLKNKKEQFGSKNVRVESSAKFNNLKLINFISSAKKHKNKENEQKKKNVK